MEIRGFIQCLNSERRTTIRPGDIIAYDAELKRIAFMRSSELGSWGFISNVAGNYIPGHQHLSLRFDEQDWWVILSLLCHATGLSADQVVEARTYKWAFKFRETEQGRFDAGKYALRSGDILAYSASEHSLIVLRPDNSSDNGLQNTVFSIIYPGHYRLSARFEFMDLLVIVVLITAVTGMTAVTAATDNPDDWAFEFK